MAASDERQVWELRVHGVGNTPPESVLKTAGDRDVAGDPPRMRQVAGDRITGFYRREPAPPSDDGVVVEAYSWGQLTAGVRRQNLVFGLRRAGWTLLLPFALINAALWARPDIPYDPDERGATAFSAWLVRAIAVGLTCTLVLAVAGVSMDVVAWQCAKSCGGPGWIADLMHQPFLTGGVRRALAGSVIPLSLIGAYYWLAGSSYHYEAIAPRRLDPQWGDRTYGIRLEHPDFWRGAEQVRALRLVHTGAAVAVVGHSLAACVWVSRKDPEWVRRMALAASVVALAAVALSLFALCLRPIRRRGAAEPSQLTSVVLTMPLILGVCSLGAAVVAAWNVAVPPSPPRSPFVTMPGLDASIRVTYLLIFIALLALMLVTGSQAESLGRLGTGADSAVWSGLAAPVFAGAAWIVVIVYSVTMLFGVQTLMSTGAAAGQPEFAVMMQWSAVGLLAGTMISVAAGIIGLVRLVRARGCEAREFRRLVNPENRHAHRRATAVGGARGVHRFVGYQALSSVGWLAIAVLALIVAGAVVAVGRDRNGTSARGHGLSWTLLAYELGDAPTGLPLAVGSFLAVAIFICLVAVGFMASRVAPVQRTLGIVWDIVTFWPRGAHPFAPPCYAEQAVPQLVTRLEGIPDLPAVLAGHSQGSILCAATVAQLSDRRRQDTFLLTFGTQLSRLYGRAFPAIFARDGRHRLATLLGGSDADDSPWAQVRWRNLYRDTDFLGWPISSTRRARDPRSRDESDDLGRVVDIAVTDPAGLDPATGRGLEPVEGEIVDPPILGHSDYPLAPEYSAARIDAATRLRGADRTARATGDLAVAPRSRPTAAAPRGSVQPRVQTRPVRRRLAVLVGLAAATLALPFLSAGGSTPAQAPKEARAAAPEDTQASDRSKGSEGSAATSAADVARVLPVSLARPAVVATIPIGSHVSGVAVAPDGSFAYVARIEDASLAVLETGTNRVVGRVGTAGSPPRAVTFSPDGRHAYITLFGPTGNPLDGTSHGNTVLEIDTSRRRVSATIRVGANAYSAAVTPDERYVYVAAHNASALSIIDVKTHRVSTLRTRPNPHAVAFLANGTKGYVTNHESSQVSVVDLHQQRVTRTVVVGKSPHSLAVAPDQEQVYVANFEAGSVSVLRTADDRVVGAAIPVGRNPQAVVFATDGRHAYVVNSADDTVSTIDTRTRQVTSTVTVGHGPTAIATTPDGRRAYVGNLLGRTVSVLQLS